MLRITHAYKSFGDVAVLKDISLLITPGERVGLIGPNGAGKTTLLRLLTGADTPDRGSVYVDPHARIGYLEQGLVFQPDDTVGVVLRDPREPLIARIEQLAESLSANTPAAFEAYQAALDKLDAMGGYPDPARQHAVLASLGLAGLPLDAPVAQLSGGQKTRIGLARVLLGEPNVLILDEPTNHLDLTMLEWLEDWLTRFPGAALIVSHDRVFLDRAVNKIVALDAGTRTLRVFDGNYSDYLAATLAEHEKQAQEYQDQQVELARLASAAAHLRGIAQFKVGGKADSGDKFAKGFFANRGAATAARAKRIESRIEKILTEDRVDKPRTGWQMKLPMAAAAPSGQDVLTLSGLSVGYDSRAILRDISLQIRRGERVALLGDNGAGKTTLLRAIAGRLAPLAGSMQIGASVQLGYFAQEQEELSADGTPLSAIREVARMTETDARAFLHFFLFTGDQPLKANHTLSYGERARLQLALLIARGCNFLLLDEPVNHLDLPARAQFEQALAAFDGTALVVSHDRYFVDGFATRLLVVGGGNVRELG